MLYGYTLLYGAMVLSLRHVVRKLVFRAYIESWSQDCNNSNIFLKPLFRHNFDPFVNNANLGAIARMSNGT